jgi:sulfide dehydrogenase cytochrome subunit
MTAARATLAAAFLLLSAEAGVAAAVGPPPGAAACSGCHPASDKVVSPVPRLAGRNPADIVEAFQAFRFGQRYGTVMDRIAKGFTDDEVRAIAEWYGAQR